MFIDFDGVLTFIQFERLHGGQFSFFSRDLAPCSFLRSVFPVRKYVSGVQTRHVRNVEETTASRGLSHGICNISDTFGILKFLECLYSGNLRQIVCDKAETGHWSVLSPGSARSGKTRDPSIFAVIESGIPIVVPLYHARLVVRRENDLQGS